MRGEREPADVRHDAADAQELPGLQVQQVSEEVLPQGGKDDSVILHGDWMYCRTRKEQCISTRQPIASSNLISCAMFYPTIL